jgi:hypothetical protein
MEKVNDNRHRKSAANNQQTTTRNQQHSLTATLDKQQSGLDKQYSTTNNKQLATIDTPNQHNKHPTADMDTVEKWEHSAILTETTENHQEHTVFAKISTQITLLFQ